MAKLKHCSTASYASIIAPDDYEKNKDTYDEDDFSDINQSFLEKNSLDETLESFIVNNEEKIEEKAYVPLEDKEEFKFNVGRVLLKADA